MSIRRARVSVVLCSLALVATIVACGGGGTDNPDAAGTCTPVDDGNECTADVCAGNTPVHNPVAAGTVCATGTCDATGTCVAPTCTDGAQNGDETDIDCGGSCAPASLCADGGGCAAPEDCSSGVCTGNICQAAACGDGVVQAGEGCDDGNMTNGDGCDDGTAGNCMVTGCGNGVVTGTEQCDDGNTTSGDGCDNNCTTTGCGNGVATTGEACDDGNSTEGDGCDSNCTASACGNGVVAPGEDCDDDGTADGDGCSAVCLVEPGYSCTGSPSTCVSVCGDGVVTPDEQCDDGPPASGGDGCSATCAIENGYACTGTAPSVCAPVCGDNIVIGSETCDDGNTTPVDGCGATCQIERTEIEPNEDGTPSTGGSGILGNDFDTATGIAVANANANGAINVVGGNTAVLATLGVVGDEDVFAVTNNSALPYQVRFDIWNRATGFGFGVACADAALVDTGLVIRNAAGTVLASNDDRNGAADRCSGLDFLLGPGQTVYAQVTEFGDNLAIPGYGLQVRPVAIVCGDGVVTAQFEECDDGNTDNTDACSNTCLLTGPINEVEPDGTTAEADANPIQLTGDAVIRGSIGTVVDVDLYRLVVTTTSVFRFETFAGAPGACDASTMTLRLLNNAGTEITNDNAGATNASGIAACAALVFAVTPGTYYVKVEETGVNATIAKYFLEVKVDTNLGTETELPNTMGVNDTSATADVNLTSTTGGWVFGDHTLGSDGDVYRVTVPPGQGIRAEIVEGDRAIETCEGNDLDSRLTLLDTDGTTVLVDDDDDGRGFCSAIDGTSATPRDAAAHNNTAAPKTWYVQIRNSTFATGTQQQFIYRLAVTVR